MKIGDLATATGCPVETIRFYEREALLPRPARSAGNYRVYGPAHVEQLRLVRNCRSLDMTLDEIRSLLAFREAPEENCAEVNLLLDEHIGHVAQRIADLKELEAELRKLRRRCPATTRAVACAILQTLEGEKTSSSLTRHKHGRLDRVHK
jgi:Cd(II)/Pb(II)-responsive transcriptional regulator